jgi:hypothetical protein
MGIFLGAALVLAELIPDEAGRPASDCAGRAGGKIQ